MAFGFVIVGSRDRVDDLRLVEGVRAGYLRDESDQVSVEQDLGLQARRALDAPDGVPAARQVNRTP